MARLLDAAGFVTGTYEGPGQPANSTSIEPPENAALPLQFVGGAWVLADATENRFITLLSFYSRFTQAERLQVRAAQSRDPIVADFMMLVAAASYIDLASDEAQAGVAYLEFTHLIAPGRAAQIINDDIADVERP